MDRHTLSAILVLITALTSCQGKPPHILLVVIDDLGWSDLGYQNITSIKTPNIDRLAAEGVILDNYYVQPICTPTRSALMTGKYPIHTGMQHSVIHPGEPYGLPLSMTLLPQSLKKAGYATHLVGKWHLGYFQWSYTPTYRGFDTFYGYYNGMEDYWNHQRQNILDLRDQKSPVRNMDGVYSANIFVKKAEEIITSHNASEPLFLYLPFQNVHEPTEVPKRFSDQYNYIKDETRRNYAGMVTAVDEAIKNVTDALQKKGLWDDTLMVLTTDNGGIPIYGGYNWPLRGMKVTLWEGGVRGAAIVHGTMIEKKRRKCKELLHVTDWFPTLLAISGQEGKDDDVDGFNVWDTISKGTPSPRTEILHNIDITDDFGEQPLGYGGIALRSGDMKLIMQLPNLPWFKPPELGPNNEINEELMNLAVDMMKFQKYGNVSDLMLPIHIKGGFRIKQALYNITADPEERHDLSSQFPDVVEKMKARVEFYKKGLVPKRNKPVDPEGVEAAKKNGIWGPWRDSNYDLL